MCLSDSLGFIKTTESVGVVLVFNIEFDVCLTYKTVGYTGKVKAHKRESMNPRKNYQPDNRRNDSCPKTEVGLGIGVCGDIDEKLMHLSSFCPTDTQPSFQSGT